MFVLDTNIVIYFFKGLGTVASNFLAKSPQDIGIPAIVLFELEVGIAKSKSPQKRMKQLEELTSVIHLLPFGKQEALSAALIRASLEKKGQPIGPFDLLIAGTALANNATLVTHNKKEFSKINALPLEDWYSSKI